MPNNQRLAAGGADGDARDARRLRVLVADDDRDAVLMLTTLLEDEGHRVESVFRGDDVLRAAREMDPDVVLLDIGMPGKTGYDAARELRQRFGRTRPLIIAVTAWTKASDRMLCELAGCNHHLAKPFQPSELLDLIKGTGNERARAGNGHRLTSVGLPMTLDGPRLKFSPSLVERAPEQAGIYALWEEREMIYVGRAGAGTGIRGALLRHLETGAYPCTQAATHFTWEPCPRPATREVEVLDAFKARHQRLPRCNEDPS